jgi:O-acetyl-ADP-ribose deacetylase (regulator of RNase III)
MIESSNYIRVHGQIPVGQCTFTTSGDLKLKGVKYIIHTVGPKFSESESLLPQQLLLYNAVFNSFKAADSLGCQSIAIPAISSGIYAFPLPLCA